MYLWNQEAIAALINRQMGNAPASRVLALLHTTLYDVSVAVADGATQASVASRRPRRTRRSRSPGVRIPERSYPSETAPWTPPRSPC